jgi:hypothetical protein
LSVVVFVVELYRLFFNIETCLSATHLAQMFQGNTLNSSFLNGKHDWTELVYTGCARCQNEIVGRCERNECVAAMKNVEMYIHNHFALKSSFDSFLLVPFECFVLQS